MPDRDTFLRAIRERPDADGPRLVYADWLEEQGECCRAELIRCGVVAAQPAEWRVNAAHDYKIDDNRLKLEMYPHVLDIRNGDTLRLGCEQPRRVTSRLLADRGIVAILGDAATFATVPATQRRAAVERLQELHADASQSFRAKLRAAWHAKQTSMRYTCELTGLPLSVYLATFQPMPQASHVDPEFQEERGLVSKLKCSWQWWVENAEIASELQPISEVEFTTTPSASVGHAKELVAICWPNIKFTLLRGRVIDDKWADDGFELTSSEDVHAEAGRLASRQQLDHAERQALR